MRHDDAMKTERLAKIEHCSREIAFQESVRVKFVRLAALAGATRDELEEAMKIGG